MKIPVKVPRPAPKVYRIDRLHRKNILCVNFTRINIDALERPCFSKMH